MEYFSIVYRILKTIYDSMDYPEFSEESIMPDTLHVSAPKWTAIMAELVRNEYVTGITVHEAPGCVMPLIRIVKPVLTMKGAEYLEDNTMMKRVQRTMKGIKDALPGA